VVLKAPRTTGEREDFPPPPVAKRGLRACKLFRLQLSLDKPRDWVTVKRLHRCVVKPHNWSFNQFSLTNMVMALTFKSESFSWKRCSETPKSFEYQPGGWFEMVLNTSLVRRNVAQAFLKAEHLGAPCAGLSVSGGLHLFG